MEHTYGHWHSATPRPEGAFGYIYRITHRDSGRSYIGRKQLTSCSSVLKEGNVRKTKTYKESNWKDYTSSCKPLKAQIRLEGKQAFDFEILEWTMSRGMTTYLEAKYIWQYDALSRKTLPNGQRTFWNEQCGAVKFIEPAK